MSTGWKLRCEILTREGFHVSMAQEPETSFEDDVATPRSAVLDKVQNGPTLFRRSATAMAGRSSPRQASIPRWLAWSMSPRMRRTSARTNRAREEDSGSVLGRAAGVVQKTPDGSTYLQPKTSSREVVSRLTLPRERAEPATSVSQVLRRSHRVQHAARRGRMEDEAELGRVAEHDQIISPELERWYYKRANSRGDRDQWCQSRCLRVHAKQVAAVIHAPRALDKEVTSCALTREQEPASAWQQGRERACGTPAGSGILGKWQDRGSRRCDPPARDGDRFGDRVSIEGDNQKQANFLVAARLAASGGLRELVTK